MHNETSKDSEFDNIVYQTVRNAMKKFLWSNEVEMSKCKLCSGVFLYPGSEIWISHIASKQHIKNLSRDKEKNEKICIVKELIETLYKCEENLQALTKLPSHIYNLRLTLLKFLEDTLTSLINRARDIDPSFQIDVRKRKDSQDPSEEEDAASDNVIFSTVRNSMKKYLWIDEVRSSKCTICNGKSLHFPGSKTWIEHIAGKNHLMRITAKTNKVDVFTDLYGSLDSLENALQKLDLKEEPFQIKNLRNSTLKTVQKFKKSLPLNSSQVEDIIAKMDSCVLDDDDDVRSDFSAEKKGVDNSKKPPKATVDKKAEDLVRKNSFSKVLSIVKTDLDCKSWCEENRRGNVLCFACKDTFPVSPTSLIKHVVKLRHIEETFRKEFGCDKIIELERMVKKLVICKSDLKKLVADCKRPDETSRLVQSVLIDVTRGIKHLIHQEENYVYYTVIQSVLYHGVKKTLSGGVFSCLLCKTDYAANTPDIISHVGTRTHVKNMPSTADCEKISNNLDKCEGILREVDNRMSIKCVKRALQVVEETKHALLALLPKMQQS